MTKSTLTRRALVASTAAMPAAAALGLPAAALADPGSDAELLRLGAELNGLDREWAARHALEAKEDAKWEARCEAAGLPEVDWFSMPVEERDAYDKKRSALRTEAQNADEDEEGDSIFWSDFNDRLYDLIPKIFEHQPQTLAGVAVQLLAFVHDNQEWWCSVYDGSRQTVLSRAMLKSLCAFAGITPAPMAVALARLS